MNVNGKAVISNKYPNRCAKCGKRVESHTGIAFWQKGWAVGHFECFPEYSVDVKTWADKAKAQNEKLAAEAAAKQAAKQAAIEAKKAERDALLAKLGVLTDITFDMKQTAYAYSDDYVWAHPYTGEGTLEEFKKALNTPAESGYGKLRWSGGVSVVKVDPESKQVTLTESIRLCD